MIYAEPTSSPIESKLKELDRLREQLGGQAGHAGLWLGSLRREIRASSIEGSTSIEGFRVPLGEASALVSGDHLPNPEDENRMAVACYARAMDHVGVMAGDPAFRWLDRVILDLHFDACQFQRGKDPGLWRTGPIAVTQPGGGGLAYIGPDPRDVPGLMAEVIDWLGRSDPGLHVVVRAAMAHLHVASVHPFRDGNGRISRIVQSLVLARDGLLAPELGSIEEYLGSHTPAYYAALQDAQGGSYQPDRDAGGWVEFCVDAHLEQAQRRIDQLAAAAVRWDYLEGLVAKRGWPERLVIALEQSLFYAADRRSYSGEAEVSPATASADFRRLIDAGLVTQQGKGRATRYLATDELRDGLPGVDATGAPSRH